MAQRAAVAEIAAQTGSCEWTPEGNRKAAALPYVRRRGALREKSRRMIVRTEWAHCAKPGGTAGALFPVPAVMLGRVFIFSEDLTMYTKRWRLAAASTTNPRFP